MNGRNVPHVELQDLSAHGFSYPGAPDGGPGAAPQPGSVVQIMGTRLTAVLTEGGRWVLQNDDLGDKLDRIAAKMDELVTVARRQNEFLELLTEHLTGGK